MALIDLDDDIKGEDDEESVDKVSIILGVEEIIVHLEWYVQTLISVTVRDIRTQMGIFGKKKGKKEGKKRTWLNPSKFHQQGKSSDASNRSLNHTIPLLCTNYDT